MTDTGGGKGFSGSRGKARNNLRKLPGIFEGSKATRPRRSGSRVATAVGKQSPAVESILTVAVWPELMKVGVYEAMFTAPELIYYLQQMARLIQKSASGPEEVATAFEVRVDSPFSVVQRKIRQKALDKSDHARRASQAFQAGSNRWAIDLVKHRDPTVFTVKHVVLAVRHDIDAALLTSPETILDEYVKQVVDSVISDDSKLQILSGRLWSEYRAQLRDFFDRFDKSSDWTENRIPTTMKAFPAALRGND